MEIKYDVKIPNIKRGRACVSKQIVLGFLTLGKKTMQVDFDSVTKANGLIKYVKKHGKELGLDGCQHGMTAYVWRIGNGGVEA